VNIFFYDTETTGVPAFKDPSDAPHQPHIVQFAGALVDAETNRTIASIDLIARPDGWEIPAEVAAIHGITNERALAEGVPEALILSVVYGLWMRAQRRIAHNEQFDARIVRIACKRFLGESEAEAWKAGQAECTARMSTPLCAMPPTDRMRSAGFGNYKTPKLSEAHEILLGEPLQNAHTALADVDACRRLYFHMLGMQKAAA